MITHQQQKRQQFSSFPCGLGIPVGIDWRRVGRSEDYTLVRWQIHPRHYNN